MCFKRRFKIISKKQANALTVEGIKLELKEIESLIKDEAKRGRFNLRMKVSERALEVLKYEEYHCKPDPDDNEFTIISWKNKEE